MDNSSYSHKCRPYCTRMLPRNIRSEEDGKAFFKCRFNMAKLNKKREVVSHRRAHDDPRFVLHNGQWRFEGPIDNWRIVSKPLASTVWFANEVFEMVLAPSRFEEAGAQILVLADYVADYNNKATDKMETAKQLFKTLLKAQSTINDEHKDVTSANDQSNLHEDEDANVVNNIQHEKQRSQQCLKSLPSMIHSIMQRFAGLPILTHLQAVMLISGTPVYRSTRQTKCVSFTNNRMLKSLERAADVPTENGKPAETESVSSIQGTLPKYFAYRAKVPFQEDGNKTSLYRWMKRCPQGHVKHVIMPTGGTQLNFSWPMHENFARTMLFLHSPKEWKTEEDILGGHLSFHSALLELCGLVEFKDELRTVDTEFAADVPIGVKHLVRHF